MTVRLLLFVILLLPLTASAAVYRWVDDAGNVHYSDTPPPKAQAQRTTIETNDAAETEQSVANRRAEHEQKIKQIEKAQAIDKKIAAMEKAKQQRATARCDAARKWQAKFNRPQRLYRLNDAGEREYYTEAEIKATRAEAAANVKRYCKNK